MDLFTILIIGFIAYCIIGSVPKKKPQQKSQRPEKTAWERKAETPNKPGPKGFWEMLEEMAKEGKKEQPIPRTPFPTIFGDIEWEKKEPARPKTVPQKPAYGSLGGEHTEGVWGTEGRAGIEGRPGTEGRAGIEGRKGMEGTWGEDRRLVTKGERLPSAVQFLKNTQGQASSAESEKLEEVFVHGFGKKEVVNGIIWAEILGKPRALRPYRGPRG